MYELGVTIDLCGGAFYRSKLIQFAPRFVVRNVCDSVLLLRQRTRDDDVMLTLQPGMLVFRVS